jgi:hypothetical protein
MSSISVEPVDGRTAFQPGEEIDVDVRWELDEAPALIELRLVWSTAGKGTTDVRVARTQRIEEPSAGEQRRLTVQLPRSPYSFSGTLVAICWGLELVALPQEESARLEIVIGPGGEEVRLGDPLSDLA